MLQEMIDTVTELANSVNDTFELIIKNSVREPTSLFDEKDCVNIRWEYKIISINLELKNDSWTLLGYGSDKLGFNEFNGKDLSYLLLLINEKLAILNQLEEEDKKKHG